MVQYDATSPEEYLSALENDWRKDKLLEVRRLIFKHGPELEESIKYKMLSYGSGDEALFGLNAQKGYVSLYVGSIDKIEGADEPLEPFNTGGMHQNQKDCGHSAPVWKSLLEGLQNCGEKAGRVAPRST